MHDLRQHAAAARPRCRRCRSSCRTCAPRLLEQSAAAERRRRPTRAPRASPTSVDAVVTAQGELDALRYGDVLTPRGAGRPARRRASPTTASTTSRGHHTISRGQYKQRFTLTREGDGALDTGGDPMSQYFGKYRGKVENNLDPLQLGPHPGSVPAVLGRRHAELGDAVRAVRRAAGRLLRPPADGRERVGRVRGRRPGQADLERLLLGIGEAPPSPPLPQMECLQDRRRARSPSATCPARRHHDRDEAAGVKITHDSAGTRRDHQRRRPRASSWTRPKVTINNGALEVILNAGLPRPRRRHPSMCPHGAQGDHRAGQPRVKVGGQLAAVAGDRTPTVAGCPFGAGRRGHQAAAVREGAVDASRHAREGQRASRCSCRPAPASA